MFLIGRRIKQFLVNLPLSYIQMQPVFMKVEYNCDWGICHLTNTFRPTGWYTRHRNCIEWKTYLHIYKSHSWFRALLRIIGPILGTLYSRNQRFIFHLWIYDASSDLFKPGSVEPTLGQFVLQKFIFENNHYRSYMANYKQNSSQHNKRRHIKHSGCFMLRRYFKSADAAFLTSLSFSAGDSEISASFLQLIYTTYLFLAPIPVKYTIDDTFISLLALNRQKSRVFNFLTFYFNSAHSRSHITIVVFSQTVMN